MEPFYLVRFVFDYTDIKNLGVLISSKSWMTLRASTCNRVQRSTGMNKIEPPEYQYQLFQIMSSEAN